MNDIFQMSTRYLGGFTRKATGLYVEKFKTIQPFSTGGICEYGDK